jgi:hypothetical protein
MHCSDAISRKTVRNVTDSDPVIIDAELLAVIERYMDANVDDVSCVIAKFFHILFEDADPPLMQSYEVDNFIVRSAKMLCTWCCLSIDSRCLLLKPSHLSVPGTFMAFNATRSLALGQHFYFVSSLLIPVLSKNLCDVGSNPTRIGSCGKRQNQPSCLCLRIENHVAFLLFPACSVSFWMSRVLTSI